MATLHSSYSLDTSGGGPGISGQYTVTNRHDTPSPGGYGRTNGQSRHQSGKNTAKENRNREN